MYTPFRSNRVFITFILGSHDDIDINLIMLSNNGLHSTLMVMEVSVDKQ